MYMNSGKQCISALHALLLCCASHTMKSFSLPAQRSQQQREVCSALTAMGLEYVCEDDSSGLSIDVAVPAIRLAVEVGPWTALACASNISCTGSYGAW